MTLEWYSYPGIFYKLPLGLSLGFNAILVNCLMMHQEQVVNLKLCRQGDQTERGVAKGMGTGSGGRKTHDFQSPGERLARSEKILE